MVGFAEELQDWVFNYDSEEADKVEGLAIVLGTMVGLVADGDMYARRHLLTEAAALIDNQANAIGAMTVES